MEILTNSVFLGWAAMVFVVLGVAMLARAWRMGFLCSLLGNACWIAQSLYGEARNYALEGCAAFCIIWCAWGLWNWGDRIMVPRVRYEDALRKSKRLAKIEKRLTRLSKKSV